MTKVKTGRDGFPLPSPLRESCPSPILSLQGAEWPAFQPNRVTYQLGDLRRSYGLPLTLIFSICKTGIVRAVTLREWGLGEFISVQLSAWHTVSAVHVLGVAAAFAHVDGQHAQETFPFTALAGDCSFN